MIALVRIALSRPYTFVVLALLLLLIGPLAALRTPTDIFPDIRIPVIGVVWNYTGLPPDQMAGRITTPFQRALTTTVNDIEHIVANSYTGIGIIKIFFQPNVDIRTANAQVTAISQTMIKQLPPGATPPLILNYSASTVPIIQVALSGEGLTEQNLADIGINQLRTPLVTVPGAAIPYPFGGKQRQIQIDLNSTALQARGLSGQDVANALAAQNLITPVGTQKIGSFEYTIQLNNSPLRIDELGDLPIKVVNGAMVYVRDVASVRDGNPPQTNIVHVDGNRSVLMMVLKAGATSTLDIIAGIKQKVIDVRDQMPEALKVGFIGDQSVFVRGAIEGVAFEGVVAARDVVAGEVVDTAKVMFVVVDPRRVWVNLDLGLEDVKTVTIGQTVRFRPDGAKAEAVGTVAWMSGEADHKTRTVRVRAVVDNPDGRLRANTFGAGRVILREEKNAVVVPTGAVHWEGCCHVVFVRDRDFLKEGSPKVFHVRTVRVGVRDDRQTEVIAGLLPGEVVAVKGSAALRAELLKGNLGEGCDCGKK